jgi:ParB family chromosome partitioning protein
MTLIPIDSIMVGERHRRDMGDIDSLARSIRDVGLLHPVVVRPDGTLIAGERRLHAAQRLGWNEIAVSIIDLDAVVRGEYAENAFRKDLTLSEAVAVKRALEPLERTAAKARMGSPEKFSDLSKGNALDKIAKATGVHRTTLAKAEAIVDAAEAEPEKYAKLLDDLDRTGRANGVYRRLKIAKQAELIRAEPPPLPGNGPYRVAIIDPPWPYELRDEDPSHRGVRDYPSNPSLQLRLKMLARSCMRTASSLCGSPTSSWCKEFIPPSSVMHGGSNPKLSSLGPRTKWAMVIGSAARLSTSSWPCAASPSCNPRI